MMPDTRFANAEYRSSIEQVLEGNKLCSLATVNPDATPHINTAYYSVDATFRVIILTQPSTQHSLNLGERPNVAITVFDSAQPWGKPHSGLQLFGQGKLLLGDEGRAAFSNYTERHPELLSLADTYDSLERDLESRFYGFDIKHVKLIDEAKYGEETHFEISVMR